MSGISANAFIVACTKCRFQFSPGSIRSGEPHECPNCGARAEALLFPALVRPLEAAPEPQKPFVEGEAACFYHADKPAVIPCDNCGRFLCSLCDLDLNGRHFCSSCLSSGAKKGTIQELERERKRYDNIALSLVVYPVILCGLAFVVLGPAALGVVLWKWKAPPSLVHRTRLRLVIATVLAVLETLGGVAIWIAIINS